METIVTNVKTQVNTQTTQNSVGLSNNVVNDVENFKNTLKEIDLSNGNTVSQTDSENRMVSSLNNNEVEKNDVNKNTNINNKSNNLDELKTNTQKDLVKNNAKNLVYENIKQNQKETDVLPKASLMIKEIQQLPKSKSDKNLNLEDKTLEKSNLNKDLNKTLEKSILNKDLNKTLEDKIANKDKLNKHIDNKHFNSVKSDKMLEGQITKDKNPASSLLAKENELHVLQDAQKTESFVNKVKEHHFVNKKVDNKMINSTKSNKVTESKVTHDKKVASPILAEESDLQILERGLQKVSAENLINNTDETVSLLADKHNEIQKFESNSINFIDNKMALETISDLNSKISAINSISSVADKTKTPLGAIKMSTEDVTFFVNLVENQSNNNVQANITLNQNTTVDFNDVKNQVIESSAKVSQALIEKLQESMNNNNKAFRVDFDKDVAVIMRVDSNGVLSANFIPGSSAVEQYLRNNLAELKQSFETKGLEYNELSYSSRKHNQSKQQRNGKGGNNE